MGKKSTTTATVQSRPPVIAVLGHVDHGKTTLLDTIRKTSVAAGESGGITQHIGAYQIQYQPEDKKAAERLVTFIDTPGHEAFIAMRSRGAKAADIAILVVAADDSVKPQTIESIKQIKAANIPFVVAANKVDIEGANVQRLKQDLAKAGVQVEGFGGDIPLVEVSAKTGKNISTLLDTILLLWDVSGGKVPDMSTVRAVVIETKVDKGKGMLATVIVQDGNISYGTKLYEGNKEVGKVRALHTERGTQIKIAEPGMPIQIMGLTTLPTVGAILRDVETTGETASSIIQPPKSDGIPDFLRPMDEITQKLHIVLKTDTMGSYEAIMGGMHEDIVVVSHGLGDVTEADVLQAKASSAFIVGFNVACRGSVAKLAETEKVVYRTYTIIYELLDELSEVVSGMSEVLSGEREVGQGVIKASFPFDKTVIAGTKVVSGRLAKGDWVKIVRAGQEMGRARIKSIRQGKLDVTKIEEGHECGVLFDKDIAFSLNDDIIAIIK